MTEYIEETFKEYIEEYIDDNSTKKDFEKVLAQMKNDFKKLTNKIEIKENNINIYNYLMDYCYRISLTTDETVHTSVTVELSYSGANDGTGNYKFSVDDNKIVCGSLYAHDVKVAKHKTIQKLKKIYESFQFEYLKASEFFRLLLLTVCKMSEHCDVEYNWIYSTYLSKINFDS